MIGIIDYGMGNLRSVQKGLERCRAPVCIIERPQDLAALDAAILPGVGAFRDAIAQLRRQSFVAPIEDYVASGRPLLGICLGQQLLMDRSFEDGEFEGLGLIEGDVVRFQPEPELKIPHMGWNTLDIVRSCPLLQGVQSGDSVYFVHSYHIRPTNPDVVVAQTRHGSQTFASIIGRDNLYATQFHPEKSQRVGLKMLENFATLAAQPAGLAASGA